MAIRHLRRFFEAKVLVCMIISAIIATIDLKIKVVHNDAAFRK